MYREEREDRDGLRLKKFCKGNCEDIESALRPMEEDGA